MRFSLIASKTGSRKEYRPRVGQAPFNEATGTQLETWRCEASLEFALVKILGLGENERSLVAVPASISVAMIH